MYLHNQSKKFDYYLINFQYFSFIGYWLPYLLFNKNLEAFDLVASIPGIHAT